MRPRWLRATDTLDTDLFYRGTCRKCGEKHIINRHSNGLCELCYYEAIN